MRILTRLQWLTVVLVSSWALPALALCQISEPPTGTPAEAPEPGSQESESHEGGFLLLAPLGSTDVQIIDRTGAPMRPLKRGGGHQRLEAANSSTSSAF